MRNTIVQIDDITLELSPMSKADKELVHGAFNHNKDLSSDVVAFTATMLMLKPSLKSFLIDGKPFRLKFEDNGVSIGCLQEIFQTVAARNIETLQKISFVAYEIMSRGIPFEFTDHENRPLDGVEIVSIPKHLH